MFGKIRKKQDTGNTMDMGRHRCITCGKILVKEDENDDRMECFMLRRVNGETLYICTGCAYRIYEAVGDIMETYESLGLSASGYPQAREDIGNQWVLGKEKYLQEDEGKNPAPAPAPGHNLPDGAKEEMEVPCTPQSIFEQLGRCVVGQEHARKVIAVALYSHWKRMEMEKMGRQAMKKSNILLIGPTGTGKTLLAETAAGILDVPFASVDATSLSETGYIGDDVETAIERLVEAADGDVKRAEHGIVYIDEIDKLVPHRPYDGRVGAEGVQQALLKLIEGKTVTVQKQQKRMPGIGMDEEQQVDTSGILFICGGAFVGLQEDIQKRDEKNTIGFAVASKTEEKRNGTLTGETGNRVIANADLEKYGIIPELAGRLPVKAVLEPLGKEELVRILTEPKDAIMGQYQAALAADGVELSYTREALERIAERALKEKAGARGLKSVMDNLMLETMFRVPGMGRHGSLTLTADDVDGVARLEDRLGPGQGDASCGSGEKDVEAGTGGAEGDSGCSSGRTQTEGGGFHGKYCTSA